MNKRTSILLRKYARKHELNYRKLKAQWTELPHGERGKKRVLIRKDLGLDEAKKA